MIIMWVFSKVKGKWYGVEGIRVSGFHFVLRYQDINVSGCLGIRQSLGVTEYSRSLDIRV
jgi:hypothetical protein